jgi:hypothetical protein
MRQTLLTRKKRRVNYSIFGYSFPTKIPGHLFIHFGFLLKWLPRKRNYHLNISLPSSTSDTYVKQIFQLWKSSSQRTGRVIAQAVCRRLPTAAARVRAQVKSCGICGGQSGAEAGILQILRFPLPNFIPSIAPQSPSSIIWDWYNRPVVAAVPSGLSLTPLRMNKTERTCWSLSMLIAIWERFRPRVEKLYQIHQPVTSPWRWK